MNQSYLSFWLKSSLINYSKGFNSFYQNFTHLFDHRMDLYQLNQRFPFSTIVPQPHHHLMAPHLLQWQCVWCDFLSHHIHQYHGHRLPLQNLLLCLLSFGTSRLVQHRVTIHSYCLF